MIPVHYRIKENFRVHWFIYLTFFVDLCVNSRYFYIHVLFKWMYKTWLLGLLRELRNYFLKHSYIVKFHVSIYSQLFVNYRQINFTFRYIKPPPSPYTSQWRFNFNQTDILQILFLLARLNVFQPCKLTCENYVLFIFSLYTCMYISLKNDLFFIDVLMLFVRFLRNLITCILINAEWDLFAMFLNYMFTLNRH